MDLYWSQLVDPDNGIFSAKFVKAFQPSFIENAKSMLVIAKMFIENVLNLFIVIIVQSIFAGGNKIFTRCV